MAAGKIKVTEAAALLHVSDQFVRIGMQRGILPIGTALKMSTKWTSAKSCWQSTAALMWQQNWSRSERG